MERWFISYGGLVRRRTIANWLFPTVVGATDGLKLQLLSRVGRDDRMHEAKELKCRIDCALRYGLDFARGASKIRLTRGLSAFGLFPKRRTDFASRGRSMHPPRVSVVANCGRSGDLSSFGRVVALEHLGELLSTAASLKPKGYGDDADCIARQQRTRS